MTDISDPSSSESMDPDHHGTQAAMTQGMDSDPGESSEDRPPLEIDTDYEASSLAGSDFLEGSWATVSSDDAGARAADDLASSEDGDEEDSLSGLSPRHTASAVHSESEFDAFSDSANESEDGQPANSRTYEYLTDQSWTDPDKSTPSNSTLSTVPGSFSRGLANARTPKHSRSSTLTRAHLDEHSRARLVEAQEQSIITHLEDSQVELVFPRIAGEFGAGSVDTITSSTPLLPIEEQSNASYEPRPMQHNFRASADQQSSEDDYILLPYIAGSQSQCIVTDNNLDAGATAHHAFSTYPANGRRGEKRQRIDIVRGGLEERGQRCVDSLVKPLSDDKHAESCEGEQNAEQEWIEEQFVREIPERVVDIDADGYERLNATDAFSDSLTDATENLPWDTPQGPSSLSARLIGIRTKCPVQRDWLEAVSEARSRGQFVIDPSTNSTDVAMLLGIAQERDLTFDHMPVQQEILSRLKVASPENTAQTALTLPSSRAPGHARYLHLPGMKHVKAIVTIAFPLLALIVLSRFSSIGSERPAAVENDHPSETISPPVLVTCSASFETYGDKSHFQCVHVDNQDMPETSFATENVGPESWESLPDAEKTMPTAVSERATVAPKSSDASSSQEAASVSATSLLPSVSTDLSRHRSCAKRDSAFGEPQRRDLPSKCHSPPIVEEDSRMPLDEGRRIHERQTGSAIVPALNISWYDRFFEHSLAMTTAMDHAFREGHDRLARLISKYAYPLSRTQPIRNSGRRLFSDHAAGIFEETDAIKKRIRSEISALLEVADHQLQELAIDVDQAIRHSRKRLATTIKDAVEGIEKHVGVEIPLPFVERDPGRDRTKSTVSNWAEKFWQTLHHATVTLVI